MENFTYEKHCGLGRDHDLKIAEMLAEYLRDQIPLADTFKATVAIEKRSRFPDEYVIVVPKHCNQYSTSIEHCQNCARDFLNGYRAGLKAQTKKTTKKKKHKDGIMEKLIDGSNF